MANFTAFAQKLRYGRLRLPFDIQEEAERTITICARM